MLRAALNPRRLREQIVTWWPVILLGWATIGAYGVAFYSFGLLIEPIHDDTGWSRGALSSAFSISALAGAAGAPLAGRSVDRFGGAPALVTAVVVGGGLMLVAAEATDARLFVAAWGAGTGIVGAGAFYTVTMPITARRYPRDRALAFSVLTFLGGLASPIYFPLAAVFVEWWGWRTAVQVLVATLPLTLLPAAFVRTRGPADGDDDDEPSMQAQGFATVREAYHSRRVLQMIGIFLLGGMAFTALQVHQVSVMTAAGMSLGAAATAAALRGFLSLPGRALLAILVGHLGLLRTLLATNVAMAAGIIALLAAGPVSLIATYVLLTGLAFGMITPLNGLFAIDVYGERQMGTLLGLQRLVIGPAAALGPIIVGVSADASGGYGVGLVVMFVAAAGAIALLVTMPAASSD